VAAGILRFSPSVSVRRVTASSVRMRNTLAVSVKRYWSETAIAPGLRCFGPRQTLDQRSSSRAWKIGAVAHGLAHGLALSWLPCKIHRTIAVLTEMPPLLLVLWREQHPRGHEQTTLHSSTSIVMPQEQGSEGQRSRGFTLPLREREGTCSRNLLKK